ncbi:MAG: hypothetical protein R3F14_46865, partial [Polyangiaceae bacterium]
MKVRTLTMLAAPLFVSLAAASCATIAPSDDPRDLDDENIGEAQQALVTDCVYFDTSVYTPLTVPVDFDREVVIADLSVVEDPCRTTWAPAVGCAAGTVGAWTFATLMARMAGTTPVQQFVAEWLDTFETPQAVNGFPVNPRGNFRAAFLDPWLVASGCPAGSPIVGAGACSLDLKIAPFRLLAIVNRIDLQGFTYGGETPGEARFVFGMTQLPLTGPLFDASGQLNGAELQATTIFEYKLPPTQDFCSWGANWHTLSNLPFGGVYNTHLQKLTDEFSSPGMDPSAPNFGVSIGQVRTNDIDLGFGPWVLREYRLQDVGLGFNGFALQNGTTAQTPDDSINNHPDLDAWTLANAPDIDNTEHSVPEIDPTSGTAFLGGETSASFFIWENGNTPPLSLSERYHFGFSTCNDCHTAATNTGFTHIAPRPIGAPTFLSTFLG